MANRRTKIEILGLSDRVQQLVSDGLSARKIASRLRSENPDIDISDASVVRFVATIKDAAHAEAFDTIRKHVDKTVPDDLKALEEMEAQALSWAREAGADRVDRMASAAGRITGHIELWRQTLSETDDTEQVVRKIIKICLLYITREDRLQKQRIDAMNMATKIIDLKLRQAGLLDEEGKSPVVVVDQRTTAEDLPRDVPHKSGYTPFVIPGGKHDE